MIANVETLVVFLPDIEDARAASQKIFGSGAPEYFSAETEYAKSPNTKSL